MRCPAHTTSLSATPARPACPSRASGLIIPDHALGLPVLRALSLCTCCRHYPGAADGRSLRSCHPTVSAFPGSTSGSACTSTFSRIAQRLLALRPAHSRSHQIRDRYRGASDISSPPCLPRLLPAGAVAGRGLHPLDKRRLVTAHMETGHWLASLVNRRSRQTEIHYISSGCKAHPAIRSSRKQSEQSWRKRNG